jgi:hypothetical protein
MCCVHGNVTAAAVGTSSASQLQPMAAATTAAVRAALGLCMACTALTKASKVADDCETSYLWQQSRSAGVHSPSSLPFPSPPPTSCTAEYTHEFQFCTRHTSKTVTLRMVQGKWLHIAHSSSRELHPSLCRLTALSTRVHATAAPSSSRLSPLHMWSHGTATAPFAP